MPLINVNGVICHHGIPGMEWGKRRFQNKDGTLTEAGKQRYAKRVAERAKQDWRNGGGAAVAAREIAQDIASQKNMLGMEASLEGVLSTKARLKRMREMDREYYDSPESMTAWKEAYDATYAALEREDPDALKAMIEANGGDKTSLNGYHDFDTTMDGFLDEYYDIGRDAFGKRQYGNSFSTEKLRSAEKAYQDACSYATEQLIGKYGKVKVNPEGFTMVPHKTSLEAIVKSATDILYSTPLDELREDN